MGGAAPADGVSGSLGSNTGSPSGAFQSPFNMNNVLGWLSNYFPRSSAGGVPNDVTINQPSPAGTIPNQPVPPQGLPDKAIGIPVDSGPLTAPPPTNLPAPQDQISQVTNVLPAPQAAPQGWAPQPAGTPQGWANPPGGALSQLVSQFGVAGT